MDLEPLDPLAHEVIVVTVGQAPILAHPRLARIAAQTWREVAGGALLACAALPDQVHALVEITDLSSLDRRVAAYKAGAQAATIDAIRRYHADELLDVVTRYSPVWPHMVYRVWQDGYHHRGLFSREQIARLARTLQERGAASAR